MSKDSKLVRTNNKVRQVAAALTVNGYTEIGEGSKLFIQDTILVNVEAKTFKILGTSEFIEGVKSGEIKKYEKYVSGDELIADFAPIPVEEEKPEQEPEPEEPVLASENPETKPKTAKKKTTRKKKTETKND